MYTSRLIAGILVLILILCDAWALHIPELHAQKIEHYYKYNGLFVLARQKCVAFVLVNLQGLPHLGAYSNHYYLPGLGMM